jgi:triosephosphate isomerase
MRRPFVAGNWKMNGSAASNKALLDGIKAGLAAVTSTEVAVCPPFVYLRDVAGQLQGTAVALGAQNLSEQSGGAYTGEISAAMLLDFGCRYVIVGHSERRAIYGESDALVAGKFAAARKAGLIPILCVGELLEEREAGTTEQVIARQLDAVLALEGIAAFAQAVVAYEPVWAIGTGKTASPDQAQAVHAFIRNKLAAQDATIADKLRILYGGSVKASNAVELFGMADIDGGLIGGAALQAEEFLAICRAGA